MAIEEINEEELLKAHLKGTVKQYIEYDINNREVAVTTTNSQFAVGKPALVTAYAYRDGTSLQILARREYTATWTQAMEDAQPAIP